MTCADVHAEQDSPPTARRQLERRLRKRRLPPEFLTAGGGERAEIELHVALAACVVLEEQRNQPLFAAMHVLDRISTADTAGAMAIVFVMIAVAAAVVMPRIAGVTVRSEERRSTTSSTQTVTASAWSFLQ